MSRASLHHRPGARRRAAAGIAVALAVPLTMGVSCDPGANQDDQQEQEDGGGEDGGDGEEQDDEGDDD